jgi:hypothetical protein
MLAQQISALLCLAMGLAGLPSGAVAQGASATCDWVSQDASITDNEIEGQCKQVNGVRRRTVEDLNLCVANNNGNLQAQAEYVAEPLTHLHHRVHRIFYGIKMLIWIFTA